MVWIGLAILIVLVFIFKAAGAASTQQQVGNEEILQALREAQYRQDPSGGSSMDPRFRFTKSHCGQKLMSAAQVCPKCGVRL